MTNKAKKSTLLEIISIRLKTESSSRNYFDDVTSGVVPEVRFMYLLFN